MNKSADNNQDNAPETEGSLYIRSMFQNAQQEAVEKEEFLGKWTAGRISYLKQLMSKTGQTMILSVDDIIGDKTALIIEWPTGIFYTAQTGGIGCDHPKCEGFLLTLSESLQNFDDCSYGCHHLWEMEDARIKLANDLDAFFVKDGYEYLSIDRDRLKELAEGWWPVIVNKDLGDSFMNGTRPGPFKGYIHTGNCD